MHQCAKSGSALVIVPYKRLESLGGSLQGYLACTYCDSLHLWPNYLRGLKHRKPVPKRGQAT